MDDDVVDVRLDQVNIVVRDMEAMAEFYGRLGLTIGSGPPEWAAHHRNAEPVGGIAVDLDSPEFASVWDEGWPGGSGVVLSFRTSDRDGVDTLYGRLTAAGYRRATRSRSAVATW